MITRITIVVSIKPMNYESSEISMLWYFLEFDYNTDASLVRVFRRIIFKLHQIAYLRIWMFHCEITSNSREYQPAVVDEESG